MSAALECLKQAERTVFYTKEIPKFHIWLDENYRLSKKTAHSKGAWSSHGYQRNAAYVMADLDSPEVNIIKGTQLGLSQQANAFAIYEVTERGRSVGCWLPRNEDAIYYAGTMLPAALEEMPDAAAKLLVDDVNKKDASNTNKKRTFEDGQIFTRSAESPSAYDTISISTVLQDEASRHPVKVKRKNTEEAGESPFDAVKSRMDGAQYRKHFAFSSPAGKGECAIDERFEAAEVQLEEYFPCPHEECGQFINLDFGDAKESHGIRWDRVTKKDGTRDNRATAKSAHYRCPACHERITHRQMVEQDDLFGELRSDEIRLSIDDDCYYFIDSGELAPKPYSVGIRLPGMLSRTKTFFDGVYEYLEAVDELKAGDDSKIQVFVKKYLARAYEPEETVEAVRHELLTARYEDFGAELPDEVQQIVAWWDIQDHYLQGMFIGFGYKEEAWLLKSCISMGDPQTTNSMDMVGEMMNYAFTRKDGSQLTAKLTGIDSGHRPDLAYSASLKYGKTKLIPTKGSSIATHPWIAFPNKPKVNCKKTFMTVTGPSTLKDLVFGRYRVPGAGPGFLHIPKPTEENGVSDELMEQMVAEKKSFEKGVMKWKKIRPRNEGLDCLVGCTAMIKIAQLPRYGVRLKQYADVVEENTPQQWPAVKRPKKNKRSWANLGQ